MDMRYNDMRIRRIIMHDILSFTCTYVDSINNESYSLSCQSIDLASQIGDYIIMPIVSNEGTKIVIGRISYEDGRSLCDDKCIFKSVKCGYIICDKVDLFKSQVIRNISLFTALYVWRNIVSKGNYILFIPQPEALR